MKAKTIIADSIEKILRALNDSINDHYKPTLAIVFSSIQQDWKKISNILSDKGIKVFGCTTAGEFISSEISEGGIAIMLLDLNSEYFEVVFLEEGDGNTYEAANRLGLMGKENFSNTAFIVATGWLHTDGEEIIRGIEDGYGREPVIFGGMAGDDLALEAPIVFTHDHLSEKGLAAILIDEDKVSISGIATCGWKPIGIARTVTKSTNNIVYTIDDKPALDLILKYLGVEEDKDSLKNMVLNLGAYYPLQLEREDAPPVIRTTMFGNVEDRSIVCAGHVPQGSKVRFSLPPDFDVIDTVVNECASLQNGGSQEADAVIMFSCISRYLSFGIMTSDELERVKAVWDAPFIGFFSYGEFGKSKRGKHEHHNNTCCVVTLKEKLD